MAPTAENFHKAMDIFEIRICTFVDKEGDLFEYEYISDTEFKLTKQGEAPILYDLTKAIPEREG